MVSFGVAPGFLLVKMCPTFTYSHDKVWIIAASFAACAALRLARFNVEMTEDDDHMHFSGLAFAGRGGVDRRVCDPVLRAAPRRQQAVVRRGNRSRSCRLCCRSSPCWWRC